MTLTEIFGILVLHGIADFVLQTEEMATKKSKDNFMLAMHVLTYTSAWMAVLFFISPNKVAILIFGIITYVAHFITDYLTSRWTSYLYRKGKYYGFHSFFNVIELDQLLHYFQLFILYQWLFK